MKETSVNRSAAVYYQNEFAGVLRESEKGYTFRYHERYLLDSSNRPISLTLPKTKQEYHSSVLFPFFLSLCSEGANLKRQLLSAAIEETDFFGLLLETARTDTIGAVTLRPLEYSDVQEIN